MCSTSGRGCPTFPDLEDPSPISQVLLGLLFPLLGSALPLLGPWWGKLGRRAWNLAETELGEPQPDGGRGDPVLALWMEPFHRGRRKKIGPWVPRILSSLFIHLKDGKHVGQALEGRRWEA